MKHKVGKFFSVAVLLSTTLAHNATQVAPLFSPRPQGVDAARELVGWTQQVNLADKDSVYGALSLTTEYAQSFNAHGIAKSLFGNSISDSTINISGSRVDNRGARDWLADYFYLPTDFQSTLHFNPTIKNVVVDLDFYLGLDQWVNGLFVRVNMPINWTRWDLGFCESIVNTGTQAFVAGYFNTFDIPFDDTPPCFEGVGIERKKLLNSFGDYARGRTLQGVVNLDSVTSTNATYDPLCYAKMDCGARSTTRLADLSWIIGWNFLDNLDYHLGVGVLTRAPTGNRPEAVYLFEPISGNGCHWELGAHITSHATLWRCEDENSNLGFYLDANITHLFNTRQKRTFDLDCKPLSRYMLAEKFEPTVPTTNPDVVTLAGDPLPVSEGGLGTIQATYQFANELTPIANLTTRDVKVSIGVQADVAAQLTYVNGGWNVDLGYNFWGRSCEKFKCMNNCYGCTSLIDSCSTSTACGQVKFAENSWGIKGDAYVYGFGEPDGINTVGIPLSATQSKATIHGGLNFPSGFADAGTYNPGIDNPLFATTGVGSGVEIDADPCLIAGEQTHTSIQSTLIKATDFNFVGTRGISHKIYTHVSYNWRECDRWTPYVGVGGFGEFGANGGCSSSSCVSAALSQWGVWAKAGVSFN